MYEFGTSDSTHWIYGQRATGAILQPSVVTVKWRKEMKGRVIGTNGVSVPERTFIAD
jgi:hypothetical protein